MVMLEWFSETCSVFPFFLWHLLNFVFVSVNFPAFPNLAHFLTDLGKK